MVEINLHEGIFERGWKDTKLAMHSVLFWFFDAGGGAVMAYFEPKYGVVWVFGGLIFLWVGATVCAPFKQRTEARKLLSDKLQDAAENKKAPDILNLSTARKVFRDNIKQDGKIAGLIDFWSDPDGYFLAYVRDGINQRWPLNVTGIPNGGEARCKIPLPLPPDDSTHIDTIVGADKRAYMDLEFERDSLVNFAKRWKQVEQDNEIK